ncbi:MAG: histidine--tRNA ligase [Canibacter sp.]
MAKQVNAPRGMRDFLPSEKAQREQALAIIRDIYRKHGFDEIEAPVLENYDRLHAGLGGDNEKLSFSVLKRGLRQEQLEAAVQSGNAEDLADLGLRFDLTVPLARYYATHQAELPNVFRAIHIGPVWRAERPQKGRYRQFVQADIDIIGDASPLAEIELLTATSHALDALGLRDCVIRLNDRRILLSMLTASGFAAEDHERALIEIDKLDKIGAEGVERELEEISPEAAKILGAYLAKVDPAGTDLTEAAMHKVLPDGVDQAAVQELASIAATLEGGLPQGVTITFDPTLVRGMGYYTGTIFEVAHPASGSSVAGGGRYDGMIGRFLSESVPAVGFSIGFERIIDLINIQDQQTQQAIALIWDDKIPLVELLKRKRELVAAGSRVQLAKRQKNMKPLFARLEADGFTHIATLRSGQELEIRELS